MITLVLKFYNFIGGLYRSLINKDLVSDIHVVDIDNMDISEKGFMHKRIVTGKL